MGSFPPVGMGVGGGQDMPPPPPAGSPSVAGIPPGPASMGPPGMGAAGALPKLVFEIENSLKTLARAMPDSSAEVDSIIQQLRNLVAQALQGSMGKPSPGGGMQSPGPGGGPY